MREFWIERKLCLTNFRQELPAIAFPGWSLERFKVGIAHKANLDNAYIIGQGNAHPTFQNPKSLHPKSKILASKI